MTTWISPFIVRRQRANWKLADAITGKFGCQTVYGRYEKEGYGHYRYELFGVFHGDKIPPDDKKLAVLDDLQRFAFAYLEGAADGPPESVDETDDG
jgi:hypothetical protein